MYRLLYKSRSRLATDPADIQARIDDLVALARAANARMDVTGVLIHIDGTFVQLLEGSPEAIETVFEKICRDRRHTDVQLVELAGTAERIFGQWSMAQLSSGEPRHLPLFGPCFDDRVIHNPQDAVCQLMRLAGELNRMQRSLASVAA